MTLTISAGLLAISTFMLAYYLPDITKKQKTDYKAKNFGQYIDKQVQIMLMKNKQTRDFLPKITKMLRASSFKIKGEPIKVSSFVFVSIILSIIGLCFGLKVLNNFYASLILAGIAFIFPYYLLTLDYGKNRHKLRKQTSNFLLAVSNLFNIYGDPVVALEQVLPQLKNPLKREITWFVDALKFGYPLDSCIKKVKSRLPDQILKDFFDDVRFFLKYGGDFQESILELIKQTYAREMAEMERDAKTSSTVIIFFLLIGVYFLMLFSLLKSQPETMRILVETSEGKMLVVVMLLIFVVAGFFTKKMVSMEEDD